MGVQPEDVEAFFPLEAQTRVHYFVYTKISTHEVNNTDVSSAWTILLGTAPRGLTFPNVMRPVLTFSVSLETRGGKQQDICKACSIWRSKRLVYRKLFIRGGLV